MQETTRVPNITKGQSRTHMNLLDLTLSELYQKNVVCLKFNNTATDAAKLMLENHIGDVVVIDDESGKSIPVGIVTDRDIVIATVAKGLDPKSVKLSEIMSKKIVTASESEGLGNLVKMMTDEGLSRLPIVDSSGELKGILTSKKLFQTFTNALCDLASISVAQQRREEETH